jgi:TRAP-type C4-dicarboxylate transport system substrate-binding protein
VKMKIFLIPLALLLAISLVAIGCPAPPATTTPPGPTTPAQPTTPPETTTPAAPSGTIKLIATNWTPQQMPPEAGGWDPFDYTLMFWMDTIEYETQGRVQFEFYPESTLLGMLDMWEGLKGGVADIGIVNVCAYPGVFPLTGALRLPGFFENSLQSSMVRQKVFEEGYNTAEWADVKVLWHATNEPWSISCRTKQIKTLEDLQGLKVANVGDPELSFIEALGGVPIAMPATDFFLALERGTVDAAWQDTNGQVVFGLAQEAPYITEIPGNGTADMVTVMNKDKYNSLPADIKAIFDKNMGMFFAMCHGQRFSYNHARCLDYLNAREGVPPVYILPEEERARWFAAAEPLVEAAAADLEAQGLPARETFARARELQEVYAGLGF